MMPNAGARTDFEPGDAREAAAFYRGVTDSTARAVLDFLIDHPGQRFDGRAIMTQLGLAQHRDVARAMYTIGESAAAVGRNRPWHEAQPGYTMSAGQSDLLKRARERAG